MPRVAARRRRFGRRRRPTRVTRRRGNSGSRASQAGTSNATAGATGSAGATTQPETPRQYDPSLSTKMKLIQHLAGRFKCPKCLRKAPLYGKQRWFDDPVPLTRRRIIRNLRCIKCVRGAGSPPHTLRDLFSIITMMRTLRREDKLFPFIRLRVYARLKCDYDFVNTWATRTRDMIEERARYRDRRHLFPPEPQPLDSTLETSLPPPLSLPLAPRVCFFDSTQAPPQPSRPDVTPTSLAAASKIPAAGLNLPFFGLLHSDTLDALAPAIYGDVDLDLQMQAPINLICLGEEELAYVLRAFVRNMMATLLEYLEEQAAVGNPFEEDEDGLWSNAVSYLEQKTAESWFKAQGASFLAWQITEILHTQGTVLSEADNSRLLPAVEKAMTSSPKDEDHGKHLDVYEYLDYIRKTQAPARMDSGSIHAVVKYFVSARKSFHQNGQLGERKQLQEKDPAFANVLDRWLLVTEPSIWSPEEPPANQQDPQGSAAPLIDEESS